MGFVLLGGLQVWSVVTWPELEPTNFQNEAESPTELQHSKARRHFEVQA